MPESATAATRYGSPPQAHHHSFGDPGALRRSIRLVTRRIQRCDLQECVENARLRFGWPERLGLFEGTKGVEAVKNPAADKAFVGCGRGAARRRQSAVQSGLSRVVRSHVKPCQLAQNATAGAGYLPAPAAPRSSPAGYPPRGGRAMTVGRNPYRGPAPLPPPAPAPASGMPPSRFPGPPAASGAALMLLTGMAEA